ncbi:hypothetical protein LTR91_008229 [Friedmanniomyces endolithicus]|uniref:DUF803-domain-containing protein n=1 Tax=Friedmanniomyces endolithicus TaxID=329885 RepID=A0AAN6KNM9_9PEZI|nr:hypothetical protein LTR94_012034 [Friedmanniomyces endolithicus]KAK0791786.1 hypothetical protein LTR38_010106 [Friedmanniomyces endolithicus]KAK0801432.1 hypothetical protein LTR75_008575 [Friedmanniomyces endolithicus]KAK0802393.1 hypothetical protein LTR59_005129 [Friedmanniomyces endolithicus]KAK0838439.1 hypothetical protein LTR03_012034 [Friedmanniomyces endolithicus]
MEDKYVGLTLAIIGSFGIGASFVITKTGLNAAAASHGFEGDGFAYLKNPIWWGGMVTMVIGELGNFAAYAFAPAILVTPLGALSVLIGAVLGSYILHERLGVLGRVGCATCLIGSVVIVLHAPPDKELHDIDELLHYALSLGFLTYGFLVLAFDILMIYFIAPKYGKRNPMIYLSICSTAGSVSIMAIKGLGLAFKMTFRGDNQFTSASTYVFAIMVAVCIATQMNYFNKALATFSTNIHLGIRSKDERGAYQGVDGIPVDAVGILGTRMSMQARRSGDEGHRRSSSWSLRSPAMAGGRQQQQEQGQHLMHSYDVEAANNLGELAEDSDEDSGSGRKRTSFEDASGLRQQGVGAAAAGKAAAAEGGAFGPPRRARTGEVERAGAGGKSFDKARR